jgi:vacuolar protein sorting-associated protein 35
MDRLSSYAQREAESESPEQRKKTEEESIAQLMEQMRIAKEKKAVEPEPAPAQQNGDAEEAPEIQPSTEGGSEESPKPTEASAETEETQPTETDGDIEKRRGIPNNVKLFEIFHEQVQTLVKMQRLPIQDTIGLLVSLANLALYVRKHFLLWRLY